MTGLSQMRGLPLVVVLLIIGTLWYVAAIGLNAQRVRDQLDRSGQPWTTADLISGAWSMERPVLPTPDQVLREFWKTTIGTKLDLKLTSQGIDCNKRNLICHA